ncbi:MAG: NUDIX hydrolase [Actinomycetia bacterium]|nr:NUDIX hydrolase [Actinomycetes bacterium]
MAEREFWGDEAAGAYLVAEDTGRVLLVLRSGHVNEPWTWAAVGGKIDPGETASEALVREVEEELGYDGPLRLRRIKAFLAGDFVYHNHIGYVPHEFAPSLNWESDDYAWVEPEEIDDWPDLHFGVEWLLDNGGLDL